MYTFYVYLTLFIPFILSNIRLCRNCGVHLLNIQHNILKIIKVNFDIHIVCIYTAISVVSISNTYILSRYVLISRISGLHVLVIPIILSKRLLNYI